MENGRREIFFHSGMNQIAYKKVARILTTNDCHLWLKVFRLNNIAKWRILQITENFS